MIVMMNSTKKAAYSGSNNISLTKANVLVRHHLVYLCEVGVRVTPVFQIGALPPSLPLQ